ncbi:protein of unknown function (DUF5003) [Bacteroides finegoldii]|uniref:DUF5003 domain-containing protein n=1 Tax=Bacteroides finegoldii CL09T03C10 TaxID=997888 RepID=K5BUB8_9BACE|nr:DUF5003 domain-containing protein [Bacteroides finegoldii]EKJ91617.1 hypothetical protein HMPREF1057_00452 [Bacteroides finegoldii CL09T03C10]
MKKLSLKPLGGICMKTLCKSLLFIGLLTTFGLSACSDDDDDTVTPIFPEKQNLICNAGDTREFTFTANTNWSLASSAIWCKFKTDDMEEFIMSGTAGTQTVTLLITDDNQKVGNTSVAKLELTMGGQTIVIGEITRSLVDYELTIYDKDGNEISDGEALNVGYREFAQFSVKANFRFAATNLPGWVDLEGGAMVGAVNQQVKGGLKIIENESREKYPVGADEGNVITFSDDEGRAFRSVKLSYEGMAPGVMELTRPSTNQYDWVVSLDGKTFTHGGSSTAGTGSSNTTFRNRLPFTVKTLEDDYEVVFVEKGWDGNLWVIDQSNPYELWMSYEDKNAEGKKDGHIKLTINEYVPEYGASKERTGYVLVFSRAEYESIKDDLQETIIDGEEIVYKYSEANLVLQFTQKEIKSGGDTQFFSAQNAIGNMESIECSTYMGEDASYYKSEYGVQGISEIKEPTKNIFVTVTFEIYDAKCYYLDNVGDAPNGIISPSGNTMSVSTTVAGGRDIFIVVSGETANDKAMLIVRASNITEGGGGEAETVFTVMDPTGTSQPVCKPYAGVDYGGASWIIGELGLTDLFEITEPSTSMNIYLATSKVSSYTCHETDNFSTINVGDNIVILDDKDGVNVWLGDNSIAKPILLVITGEDNQKHGLFISIK